MEFPKVKDIEAAIAVLDSLYGDLGDEDTFPCGQPPSAERCLAKAGRLAGEKVNKTGTHPGIEGYGPRMMCATCRAFWHNGQTLAILQRLLRDARDAE